MKDKERLEAERARQNAQTREFMEAIDKIFAEGGQTLLCDHRRVFKRHRDLPRTWKERLLRLHTTECFWICDDCGAEVLPVYRTKRA